MSKPLMTLTKPTAAILMAATCIATIGAQIPLPLPPTGLHIVRDGEAPPASSGHAHDYFNSLVARPQHFRSWSLRDQSQLDSLTNLGTSNFFTYSLGFDGYHHPQDGARFYRFLDGGASIPVNQQLKMPVGIGAGRVLITWDFWWGQEFRENIGEVGNYKTFQVRQGDGIWWTHVNRFKWASDPDDVSQVYESLNNGDGSDLPAGVIRREPITPYGAGALGADAFAVKASRWTRYWIELELHVPSDDPKWDDWKSIDSETAKLTGTWHMLSLWIADENRDPVRIIYRVPWVIRGTKDISSFEFEFNTSSKASPTGPLVGYARNVVVLKDYMLPSVPDTDSRIFVRPVS